MQLPSNFGATYAYYFSSMSNAAGIIKWGQFTHNYATLLPPDILLEISDSAVMRRRVSWHNDCCLYFGHHTPTQYLHVGFESDCGFVFIRYNADNLFSREGARFSTGNLASGSTRIYSAKTESERLSELNWPIILRDNRTYSTERKSVKSAELIIPHYIEPTEIHSVVVCNQSAVHLLHEWLDYISPLWDFAFRQILREISEQGIEIPLAPRQQLPPIIVDPQLYFGD